MKNINFFVNINRDENAELTRAKTINTISYQISTIISATVSKVRVNREVSEIGKSVLTHL